MLFAYFVFKNVQLPATQKLINHHIIIDSPFYEILYQPLSINIINPKFEYINIIDFWIIEFTIINTINIKNENQVEWLKNNGDAS